MHGFNFRELIKSNILRRNKIICTTERASQKGKSVVAHFQHFIECKLFFRNSVLVQLGPKWIKLTVSSERLKH